jgi:ABC-2 type transport system permease protein
MRSLFRSFIRASAFFRKEVAEVLRQPRLILTLVFGPFLILFIFGLGYNNQPRTVRTVFVADPKSPLYNQIQQYASNISPQLIFAGETGDKEAALAQLQTGQVDLVAVAPDNAYKTIQNNQQAIFALYHNEVDPAQASYIEYLGQIYVDEVNRRVLSAMAQQGQSQASNVQQDVKDARANAAAMRTALQAGNAQGVADAQRKLGGNVDSLTLALGATTGLLSGIEQNVGSGSDSNTQDILSTLTDLQKTTNADSSPSSGNADPNSELARLDKADADLAKLDQQLAEFQSISPQILVRPFGVETRNVGALQVTAVDFFTPSVIILLLQHIAVTIAALSIVRERRSGTMELFRVAPVSSLETMIGKYVSYLIFGIVIAAILTLLIYFGLHMPMLGSWTNYGLVGLAVLFASLGLGFVISLIADTESHAVQLSMIALLVSVFFSGFLLDLRYFFVPVRVLSYAIPATYGINMLQNVMLRGKELPPIYFGGLLAYGLVFFLIAWLLMRRLMARR